MDFILYHRRVAKTGQALKNVLNINGGTEPVHGISRLIRWGHAGTAATRSELNSRAAIMAASHKYNALKGLSASGVPVPRFSRNVTEIKFPAIVRKDSHFGGRGFGLILQQQDVKHWASRGIKDYYIEYIPTHLEYRVHVWNNEAIRVQKKKFSLKELQERINIQEARFLRNYNNGWTFHGVKLLETPKVIMDAALAAVKTLGLIFGAVDIILGDDQKAYVLEVNTAPGLPSTRSLTRYAEKMADFVGINKDTVFYERIHTEAKKLQEEYAEDLLTTV